MPQHNDKYMSLIFHKQVFFVIKCKKRWAKIISLADLTFFSILSPTAATCGWQHLYLFNKEDCQCLDRTSGQRFRSFPSPDGAAAHARGTLQPYSVAQWCRAARLGNTSTPFRRPMWPRRTLGEHFSPIPSPDGAEPHARVTFLPLSVARWCRGARPGNTSAHFRSPMVPRRTPGEHFSPVPSPNVAAPHAWGTLQPNSVAQWCRPARSRNTSAQFRRPTAPRRTLGRHFSPVPSPNGAAQHARGTFSPVP